MASQGRRSERLLTDPAILVRYNAASSLAARGSGAGCAVLRRMLDVEVLKTLWDLKSAFCNLLSEL